MKAANMQSLHCKFSVHKVGTNHTHFDMHFEDHCRDVTGAGIAQSV
jgi:hypothetical protein